MKVEFKSSFFKDVKKSPNTFYEELDSILSIIESAQSLKEIPNLKKLKGHKIAYRIRIKTYRLCFYYEDDIIVIARFMPRKDVYRSFP